MDHVTIAERGYAKSLTGLRPAVSAERLIGELVPPPRFAGTRFSDYLPDPAEPTQVEARDLLAARAARGPPDPRPPAAGCCAAPGSRPPRAAASTSTAATASARPTCSPRSGTRPRGRRSTAPSSSTRIWSARSDSARRSPCSPPSGWCASTSSNSTTRATRCWSRRCSPGSPRPACSWPRPPTRCPGSSARAASPPTTSCARSRAWPDVSPPSGSRATTTGGATARARPSRSNRNSCASSASGAPPRTRISTISTTSSSI